MVYGGSFDDDLVQIVPCGSFGGAEITYGSNTNINTICDTFNNANVFSPASPPINVDDIDRLLDDGQRSVPYSDHNQQYFYQSDFMSADYYAPQPIKQQDFEPKTLLECLNFPSPAAQTTSRAPPQYSDCHRQPQQQQCQMGQQDVYGLGQEKIEQVEQLARRMAMYDVNAACKNLHISPEPRLWSSQDTRAWLYWICQQYNLLDLNLIDPRDFDVDGWNLCHMKESEFRQLAPSCGEFLFYILDIWKNASVVKNEEFSYMNMNATSSNIACIDAMSGNTYNIIPAAQTITNNNTFSDAYMIPMSNRSFSMSGSPASSYENDSGIDNVDTISEDGESMGSADEPQPLGTTSGSHTHLWQFLKELLSKPNAFGSAIRWVDRSKGIFKIEDSVRVARLWGKKKNRPAMNYDKLSRSIRQYYKKGIMKKTERSQRLVYQFCAPYAS